MLPHLIEFYNNWTAKADNITGNSLSDVYDKFITRFIIYNNLYNQVPAQLVVRGVKLPNDLGDRKKATVCVVKYLGGAKIIDKLDCANKTQDIVNITQLIEAKRFHIKLKHGASQREEDEKILNKMSSVTKSEKAMGILEVIYHVRCNMFHGHKAIDEYQRDLVLPLADILKEINTLLNNELRNEINNHSVGRNLN